MQSHALLLLQALMVAGLRLLKDWHIPGTNISPLSLILFSTVTFISLRLIGSIVSRNYNTNISTFKKDE